MLCKYVTLLKSIITLVVS